MMTRSLVFCTAVLLCCLIAPQAHGQGTAPDSTAVFHQDLAWSPDGRWIVFSANPGAGYDLWLARADGSAMKPLTADGKGNLWAAWSPDGKAIAYTSSRDGGTDIY